MIEWATDRFVAAGLQLPDLEISFPVSCGGKAARYHVGQNRIDLCRLNQRLVLHELAHAWDDNGDVDREQFMERRGVDHWYAQPGRPSHESGGEQLAHIIAWGLMDVETMRQFTEYAGQPIDEQPWILTGVEGASRAHLAEVFTELTGVLPIVGRTEA